MLIGLLVTKDIRFFDVKRDQLFCKMKHKMHRALLRWVLFALVSEVSKLADLRATFPQFELIAGDRRISHHFALETNNCLKNIFLLQAHDTCCVVLQNV